MEPLTDLEHVRLRPGMYVGDVGTRGLHHLLDELLDNAIDQFPGQTNGDTHWQAFANGRIAWGQRGTHLTALKRAVAACKLKPAVAMIHIIMRNPKLSGPTQNILHAEEVFSPIYEALKPRFQEFAASQ